MREGHTADATNFHLAAESRLRAASEEGPTRLKLFNEAVFHAILAHLLHGPLKNVNSGTGLLMIEG
jgi:hypothetical protein